MFYDYIDVHISLQNQFYLIVIEYRTHIWWVDGCVVGKLRGFTFYFILDTGCYVSGFLSYWADISLLFTWQLLCYVLKICGYCLLVYHPYHL